MITDIRRRVMTEYKTNTRDHESGHRRMRDEIKRTAAEEDKAEAKRKSNHLEGLARTGKLLVNLELYKKAIGIADKSLSEFAKNSEIAEKQVKELRESVGDAFDKVQASIGKAVVGLTPLISGLGKVVTLLDEVGALGPVAIGALALAITGNPAIAALLALGAAGGFDGVPMNAQEARAYMEGKRNAAARVTQLTGDIAGAVGGFSTEPGLWSKFNSTITSAVDVGVRRGLGVSEWSMPYRGKSTTPDRRDARWSLDNWYQTEGSNVRVGDYDLRLGQRASENLDEYGNQRDPLAGMMERFDAENKAAELEHSTRESRYSEFQGRQQKPFLEDTFGPLDQFSAYAAGFQMLSGAVTSALGAWIDGSASAGEAIKRFLGESMKALAQNMAVEALKESAYAIASLARYDYGGAALHGKAAGMFAVGAAVAAVAARSLGGGGAAAGAGAGAGATPTAPQTYGGGPFGGSGASDGGAPVIVIGDSFQEMTPRQRGLSARKIVNRAIGTNAVVYR